MENQTLHRAVTAPRRLVLLALVVIALGVAIVASVAVGSAPSSLADLWHAVVSPSATTMDVTIRELRWPRTVLGIVVGACLGLAGVMVQGHTRNPIADPGLLGIFQGAALAVVATTALAGTVHWLVLAIMAFVGALLASVLVFTIAHLAGRGATPITLVLAGAAVAALCAALVTAIVLFNEAALDTLRFWQVGSLSGRSGAIELVWPFALAGGVLAVANTSSLNVLALGEETAQSLGVSLRRSRTVGIAAITLLAGSAVMMAGPIAFAGLVVPHLARAVVGGDYRWLIPTSAVAGAALLLVADTVGRIVARPGELPAAVILAVIGAPFFVLLARRRKLVTL